MDALEAIRNRRSVRNYNDQPVTDDELEIILDAAMSAPSGQNLQHWHFVAVRSEDQRQIVFDIMEKVSLAIADELDERFKKYPQVAAQTKQFIKTCGKAPVVLLVFMRNNEYKNMDAALQSVAAAIENACIAARAIDIGSCWMTAAPQTGFSEEFRRHFAPDMGSLVATVTLGHTDEWPAQIKHKDGRYTII